MIKTIKKLILILIPLLLLIGCKTTDIQDGEHIKEFSKTVGKLEILIEDMENTSIQNKQTLGNALLKASTLESEIERLDLLFSTYESLVNSMIDENTKEIENLRATLKEFNNYENENEN